MMLKLIAAQLDEALRLWKYLIKRKRCPSPFPHVTTHPWDVELCDALDTLADLEQQTANMDIPQYERFLITRYRDDEAKCQCRQCAPAAEVIWELWDYAAICHKLRPPALFERVFAELRRLATT
ncbi:hypothetical protein EXIGLDRAFT_835921 [Exidia glandulosa HHB12029]|uniref:Uncharacterized protein n=1 Tax=Exidia glandulosa HHB12029 TaxID=1314781 RepID=A0A165IA70_EXIGL|nr:hypothetical protein EXIGLDRAFT_835921 [Exidia glandulosa HHB12029]